LIFLSNGDDTRAEFSEDELKRVLPEETGEQGKKEEDLERGSLDWRQ
jgi:hypothetical protein